MKVFISWRGERSHSLGDALHDWIPLILHYVELWLSQADIEAGQRWAEQVAQELHPELRDHLCDARKRRIPVGANRGRDSFDPMKWVSR